MNHNDMNPHDDPRELRWIMNADNQKIRRHDRARREEENKQLHTRREQPGVLGHESIQRATARLDPARREEHNPPTHQNARRQD